MERNVYYSEYVLFLNSDEKYLLHVELLNFMLISMSTQLLSGPSPRPKDFNPFIDAAMSQVTGFLTWSNIKIYKFTAAKFLVGFSGQGLSNCGHAETTTELYKSAQRTLK